MSDDKKIQCIGFIMDGNRRWAKAHGLSKFEGHAEGYKALKALIKEVYRKKISHMVCYAFSTENWKRDPKEVAYLMELLSQAIPEFVKETAKESVHINLRIIGEIECFPENLQKEIADAELKNTDNSKLTVWIALSYGGRAEIVRATNKAIKKGEPVDEKMFQKFLWTDGMPDPDLIIRTSGEVRTSNFLIWQSAYSELFFTETLWPDFGETEFQSILEEYANRTRRRGA